MELNHFPGTSPDALSAIRAASIDDPDIGFHQFDRIFRANANAASAEIAFAGNNMNHQRTVSGHESLVTLI